MQLSLFNQRWRERRESYQPVGEPINPETLRGCRTGRRPRSERVHPDTHHYGASYPSARVRFSLFTEGRLVGVVVFSHPCNDWVLTAVFPLSPLESLELGRFVLLDDVPANGESRFPSERAFECLQRKGLAGVVSFSDLVPRTTSDGTIMHRGHAGIYYQATASTYLGRTEHRTVRLAFLLYHRRLIAARSCTGDKPKMRYIALRGKQKEGKKRERCLKTEKENKGSRKPGA